MPPHVLHPTLLLGCRTLLHNLSGRGVAHSQEARAQTTILTRVRRPCIRSDVDPFRAFSRLKHLLVTAKTVGRVGRQKAKEQWQRALDHGRVLRRGVPREAAAAGTEPPPRELAELFGHNGFLRSVLMLTVGAASKVLMQGLNTTVVKGGDVLKEALHRPNRQALITVSNHVASLDDPLTMAPVVPLQDMANSESLRWTLCATDRCFKSPTYGSFCRACKVLPVKRGAGLHQPGMKAAEYRLSQGDWLHIFPEGTRSRNGELLPMRQGVGRLIASCAQMPLVVPFVHSGMEKVLPVGSAVPRPGNKVSVLVGEPVPLDDLFAASKAQHWPEHKLYTAITWRVGLSLADLWCQLEGNKRPSWAIGHQSDSVSDLESDRCWWERCHGCTRHMQPWQKLSMGGNWAQRIGPGWSWSRDSVVGDVFQWCRSLVRYLEYRTLQQRFAVDMFTE